MSRGEMPLATILVADDSEQSRELLRHLLVSEGYRVIDVADGLRALAAIREQPVDLIILDVLMPGKSGLEVCQAVKSQAETRLIPVVLITGLADGEDRIRGIVCGADDFLTKPFRREELLARVRSLVRLKRFTDDLESAETVLCSLARSIEAKDPYTVGHCDRLAQYSVALAARIGLPGEQQTALRRAGIVHDVGKVVVPDSILLKPGPLTMEEKRIVEEHPLVGERICAPLKSFRHVLPIIRHHHEKMDGTGYPDRLRGEAVPLTARVLQVVDIYDALTTTRPYRAAMTVHDAFALIWSEVGKGWWDGELVRVLEEMVSFSVELEKVGGG